MGENDERNRANRILERLTKSFPIEAKDYVSLAVNEESKDPFRVLVATILSQSCTDTNALRAYRNLEAKIGVSPHRLAVIPSRRIEAAIESAGLQRQKSRAIKRLALVVSESHGGNLRSVLSLPQEEARGILMELPKVGPKTADVLLSIFKRPAVAVDTHVRRVSQRLGLTPLKGNYEQIRRSLLALFDESDYSRVSLLLIALGRNVCKARRPDCPICPVEELCPYPSKTPSQK